MVPWMGRSGGARPRTVVCGFNNRNAQKCAIAHLIRHSGLPELAIERKWGFRSCSAADNTTVAGWCVRWYMHIVEPWRLFLLSSASLCCAGVESTGAHGMRTCRPFASSAFGCECLSSPPASRCPRQG